MFDFLGYVAVACLVGKMTLAAARVVTNRSDKEGEYQLRREIINGNAIRVEKLLSEGVDPNNQGPGNRGSTPLHYAAVSGNLTVIRILLSAGSNVTAKKLTDGMTPWDLADDTIRSACPELDPNKSQRQA